MVGSLSGNSKKNDNEPDGGAKTPEIPRGFKLLHTFEGHTNIISRMAWSPDGRFLASPSLDGTTRVWNWQERTHVITFEDPSSSIYSLAWSPDGRRIATGTNDGHIRIWDIGSGKLVDARKVSKLRIECLAWNIKNELASACADASIKIWSDGNIQQTPLTLTQHTAWANAVAWTKDGDILASAAEDYKVILWDGMGGELKYELKGHSDAWVLDVVFDPNGKILASAGRDNAICIWDSQTGKLIRILEGHTDGLRRVSFSNDGQWLISKARDNTVRVWNCDTWENAATLPEQTTSNTEATPSAVFHPHLPIVATLGDQDRVIRIWLLDYAALNNNIPFVHYTSAKITLVGESGVGKSGLGWRLATGEFRKTESTHGQQFWVVNELGKIRDDGTQCEAILWDFAGQPDYRLVHALFLNDVNLALLLFDPTEHSEPLRGIRFWLRQLEATKPDCRIILVAARSDRGTCTLAQDEIAEFCKINGIHRYVSTSALNGMGIDELINIIKNNINWESMVMTVTTTTFKRIKVYVLRLKEDPQRQGILVTWAGLRRCLEITDADWEFSDAELKTAVGHLENHGYVTILTNSMGDEYVLLTPDILTNLAASFVLEARRNPRGLGALDEEQLLSGNYDFPELHRLNEHEKKILLDAAVSLFIEHNICLRETSETQTLLIFPSLINQKRPFLETIDTVDDLSYRVTGAVENVYAILVVRLGYTNLFHHTHQWQNQAQYIMQKHEVCGFRLVDEREGELELVLYYGLETPEYTRQMFAGMFEKFLREHDVQVTKYLPIVCPKCQTLQERASVVKRVQQGKSDVFCANCGEHILLPSATDKIGLNRTQEDIADFEGVRTHARTVYETALVRIKGFLRDRSERNLPVCFISYAWGKPEQENWVLQLGTELRKAGVNVLLDRWDLKQGGDIARFMARINATETTHVLVIGTPLYRDKYENKNSKRGAAVAVEVDQIDYRITSGTKSQRESILPILLDGKNEQEALPTLLWGKLFSDFRDEYLYFVNLFDLVLSLYDISYNDPAFFDLRQQIASACERMHH